MGKQSRELSPKLSLMRPPMCTLNDVYEIDIKIVVLCCERFSKEEVF